MPSRNKKCSLLERLTVTQTTTTTKIKIKRSLEGYQVSPCEWNFDNVVLCWCRGPSFLVCMHNQSATPFGDEFDQLSGLFRCSTGLTPQLGSHGGLFRSPARCAPLLLPPTLRRMLFSTCSSVFVLSHRFIAAMGRPFLFTLQSSQLGEWFPVAILMRRMSPIDAVQCAG